MSEKKKICSWLDSNIRGGIQILNDGIWPCCGESMPMIKEENLDYENLTVEQIQKERQKVYELINTSGLCKNCPQLIEKEEKDIDVGKIQYLSVGLFATCNLRCRYCYFTHEELGSKLSPKRTKLLPIVKKFADADMLKDSVEVGVAGGEPTLFEDIPETLHFLAQRYKQPKFILLSNSSIEAKTKKLAKSLAEINENIYKVLYTSIDAGTASTYKNIRGRDLYKTVQKNILHYAKMNSFNKIALKYILMFDKSNTSDKDIFGFLKFVMQVMLVQKGDVEITIDCDMLSKEPFDLEMIAAAGKLYYVITQILNLQVTYVGGSISYSSPLGRERIKLLEDYALEYKKCSKSFKENFYITIFKMAFGVILFKRIFKLKNIKRLFKVMYILNR